MKKKTGGLGSLIFYALRQDPSPQQPLESPGGAGEGCGQGEPVITVRLCPLRRDCFFTICSSLGLGINTRLPGKPSF